MTEFDQLIKNKAEEAQYSYKPSAWKSFLVYSGAKTSTLLIWVAAAAVAVSVVAVSTYFLLRPQPQEQPTLPETEPIAVCVDTIPADVADAVEPVAEEKPLQVVVTTPTILQEGFDLEAEYEASKEQSVENTEQKPVPPTNNPRLEPVRIIVDTITRMEPTDEELQNGNSNLY